MVLRYSWHACERVRARSRRKTRFSASASVWNQLAAAGGAVSAIEHPADGATGGARGRLVLRCSWLACERVRRAQRLDSVHLRASGTSRNRHRLRNRAPRRWRHRGRSGATGAQVLVHACERLTSDGRRVIDAHVRASRTDSGAAATSARLPPGSCRQFPPFRFVLVEALCYIPLRLEK